DAHISGDRMHLTNVIFNLLDNAIKYNTEAPVIEVSTRNVNHHLEVTIKDNGIGISAKNVKKIFDRFFRVSTGDVHDVKGFGLGLYYVRHVVRGHKGKISVQSEPGKGTAITINFPQ